MEANSNVSLQLNTDHETQREKNRAALRSIISVLEYHGRSGEGLRGHRDSGQLSTSFESGSCIDYSQGKFRATLQLVIKHGDKVLKDHLDSKSKRGTYISSHSQNTLIENIFTVQKRLIVTMVEDGRFFSLLADETTDASGVEQLSVVLRFVNENCDVQERFLCFEKVVDLTGKGLATTLERILLSAGISMENIVGQGYDGAAAMSGQHNGVQKFVKDRYPTATYVHCVSHCLNLCLEKAATVVEVAACITTMREIIIFFRESNKRSRITFTYRTLCSQPIAVLFRICIPPPCLLSNIA